MTVKTLRLVCLVACFAIIVPALAQTGHPLKGSWSGDWGPTADHRNRVLLLLDWDGNELTGIVNPGPNAIPLTVAELDVSDWTIHFEATAQDFRGNDVQFVIDGQLENIGSWTNRTLSGSWNHGDVNGDFKVVMN